MNESLNVTFIFAQSIARLKNSSRFVEISKNQIRCEWSRDEISRKTNKKKTMSIANLIELFDQETLSNECQRWALTNGKFDIDSIRFVSIWFKKRISFRFCSTTFCREKSTVDHSISDDDLSVAVSSTRISTCTRTSNDHQCIDLSTRIKHRFNGRNF